MKKRITVRTNLTKSPTPSNKNLLDGISIETQELVVLNPNSEFQLKAVLHNRSDTGRMVNLTLSSTQSSIAVSLPYPSVFIPSNGKTAIFLGIKAPSIPCDSAISIELS